MFICSFMSTQDPMDCIVHQAHLSMKFSRQEHCSGLPFPTPGGFSPSRDWTHVSCIFWYGRWLLYHLWHLESPVQYLLGGKMVRMSRLTRADSEGAAPSGMVWVTDTGHFFQVSERVTGRKVRGLQKEERGCKHQTFVSLKRQEETNQRYVFPSLHKFKRRFLLKCCVAMTPGLTWS